jgi:hypothetical protein
VVPVQVVSPSDVTTLISQCSSKTSLPLQPSSAKLCTWYLTAPNAGTTRTARTAARCVMVFMAGCEGPARVAYRPSAPRRPFCASCLTIRSVLPFVIFRPQRSKGRQMDFDGVFDSFTPTYRRLFHPFESHALERLAGTGD